jgi:hypothetical protein
MFTPSQHDVRRFFCVTFEKMEQGAVLTPLESMAANWISQHKEYYFVLQNVDHALALDYSVEKGQENPFLHLAMHLSIAEQISINQPLGILEAYRALVQKLNSEHLAYHQIMECLGEALWQSQRSGLPLDEKKYIACILKRLGV